MTIPYQGVLFVVFTGFFVLIGAASISVLLGFPKRADPQFRKWAIPGFLAGVTTAIFGLFRIAFLAGTAPILVTLNFPPEAPASIYLKGGVYETLDENSVNRTGRLVPFLAAARATWTVQIPGDAYNKFTTLHLEAEDGSWWQVGPFFPNYQEKDVRTSQPFRVGDAHGPLPGVAILSAAEGGGVAGAQAAAGIHFNNYARRVADRYGRAYFEWRVFVDEPPSVLEKITQVDYVLHPTFPEPFQSSRDRNKRFELSESGWGEFTIVITVHYTDGKQARTTYPLSLQKNWPAEAPTPSSLHITLERIHVEWNGSPGSTVWAFEVLIDGKTLLRMPNKRFDEGKGHNDYDERLVAEVVPTASGQVLRIEIRGRSSTGDTAMGTAILDANGGQKVIGVRNQQNPKKASFLFYLKATR